MGRPFERGPERPQAQGRGTGRPIVDGRENLSAPPALDSALLVIALAGVSFSGPLMAATAAPALAIAFWRNALGAGVTALFVGTRHLAQLRDLDRRAVGVAAVAGVALAVHFATWVPSVTMTTVASATALVSTQAIFVALIARWRGRNLPSAAWVGVVVATIGTALITGADVGTSGRALAGDALAIAGGLSAGVYVTIGAQARRRMTTASYTVICYTVCSLVLFGACLLGRVPLHGFSTNAWVKIVLVTVAAQLLGHSLINLVLRSTSATVVSLAILLETPGAGIVAYVWLHQRPPWTAIPGLALLFAGLVVVARSRGEGAPLEALE
ncbi:MAG: EamA family transporter [Pseudonocardiales bacterium]|nr:MAG: EamA family transporter [Pseudonocardiales bacterium]